MTLGTPLKRASGSGIRPLTGRGAGASTSAELMKAIEKARDELKNARKARDIIMSNIHKVPFTSKRSDSIFSQIRTFDRNIERLLSLKRKLENKGYNSEQFIEINKIASEIQSILDNVIAEYDIKIRELNKEIGKKRDKFFTVDDSDDETPEEYEPLEEYSSSEEEEEEEEPEEEFDFEAFEKAHINGKGLKDKIKTAEEIGSQAVRLIEEIERLLNIDDAKQASIYYPQYKRHKKVFNELYDKLEDSYSLTPALRAMRKHMEDIEDSLKNR